MVDFVYSDGLKALQKRMGTLFNNVKSSDTVFTVKGQRFFVLSEVVSVASSKLDSVIREHFFHCNNKEITLHDVKCEDSFSVVLQYMYGLDINFSQMKMSVMCETINLAEKYKLNEFSEDLKKFLSQVDNFELESLAILLNTSRKYNLNELYEKLKVFAFEHAKDFVKHDSIVQLQYEVLLNLIKSDWFCAPEFDILMGVLIWHNEMNPKEKDAHYEKGIEIDFDVEIQSNDVEADQSNDEADQSNDEEADKSNDVEADQSNDVEADQSNDEEADDEDDAGEENEDIESEKEAEASSVDDSDENNSISEITSNKTNDCAELVKSFSENVLKSLLLHIRVKEISMFDFIELSKTSLFEKYRDVVGNNALFCQISESRHEYGTVVNEKKDTVDESVSQSNEPPLSTEHDETLARETTFIIHVPGTNLLELRNIKRTLQVGKHHLFIGNQLFDKNVLFINEQFMWIIWVFNTFSSLHIYVQCLSEIKQLWYCTAECQLTLVSPFKNKPSNVSPVKSVIFGNLQYSSQEIGSLKWSKCEGWKDAFQSQGFVKIEIHFKSITIQINEHND